MHEKRHHLNMKADIQVTLLSQGLPADHQKLERGLDQRGTHPAHTGIPDFRPPELRDNKALLSSCPVCGDLSQLPQETDTASWGHSSAQHCVGDPCSQPSVIWGTGPPSPQIYPPQAEERGLCFSSISTHSPHSNCHLTWASVGTRYRAQTASARRDPHPGSSLQALSVVGLHLCLSLKRRPKDSP